MTERKRWRRGYQDRAADRATQSLCMTNASRLPDCKFTLFLIIMSMRQLGRLGPIRHLEVKSPVCFPLWDFLQINLRLSATAHTGYVIRAQWRPGGTVVCVMCVMGMLCCAVPMPVSGGWAAFEAMMGAAFAPIAVAGGVSILACRQRERGGDGENVI